MSQNGGSGESSGGRPGEGTGQSTQESPDRPDQPNQSTPQENGPTPDTVAAYRDARANLQNQLQQISSLVPSTTVDSLRQAIIRYDKDTSFRQATPHDIVRFYTDLQKPLEKLILELEKLQEHAQRTEVVKTPDLNETPLSYRAAVSDYFEALSRDYHPADAPAPDAKTSAPDAPADAASTPTPPAAPAPAPAPPASHP